MTTPPGTPPSHLDGDDGRAHLFNADTTTITFIYTNTAGTLPPDGMGIGESTTSAFKAAAPAEPQSTTKPPTQ